MPIPTPINTCPIKQLTVQPYQRSNDTMTWYPIKIEFYTNQSFITKYTYSEFVQFSRQLHRQFDTSTMIKKSLPTIKKENYYYYTFLKKGNQKYIDRQLELEEFCKKLLVLPAIITCSDLFLSFFSNYKHQQITTSSSSSTLKRVFSIKNNSNSTHQITITNNKSLFQNSNPTKRFSISSNKENDLTEIGLLSPLSPGTPQDQQHSRISMISTTTCGGGRSCRSSATSSMLFSSSLSSSSEEDLSIKLKIVYDCNNIVIIRVPRSISLDQLRIQVIQKFALLNIELPQEKLYFTCIENARYSSASSIIYSDSLDLGAASVTLITEDEQLFKAMQTKWSCLPKVTLRCIV